MTPTLLWSWTGADRVMPSYNQVMMTPVVANLTDDNGDGRVNENDIADVVFSTFFQSAGINYSNDGILRAVSGDDGRALWDATGNHVIAGASVAAGDIDGDGLVEIVTCGAAMNGQGQLTAFENDGTFKWRVTDARVLCGMGAPGIADFDGDGRPEVWIRYSVVNGMDGSVRWSQPCAASDNWNTYQNSCDFSVASDLNGDGRLELIGGNVAFRGDGTVFWDRRPMLRGGYPAIGDLDLDGDPEVVVVQPNYYPMAYQGDHYLLALEGRTGATRWGPVDINQGRADPAHVLTGGVAGGGPPTIANFDDDPQPEIALAGGYGYAVFEPSGMLRWFAPTRDLSSRITGSSVFDFDGDGIAEAVYNDEYWLRVYDGPTGRVRFCACNTSGTLWEYPVIADVNNDGHAEIIVSHNDYTISQCSAAVALDDCTRAQVQAGDTVGGHGVRVFAGPRRDWVATRRIWNQHSYHVTNVSESGTIPRNERANWTLRGLNNFRQNVQPGATNIPDLRPEELAVDLIPCPTAMILHFRVRNAGASAVAANVPVTIYVRDAMGMDRVLATVRTTRSLFAGESEALQARFDLGMLPPSANYRFTVVINDPMNMPNGAIRDCRPENNRAETTGACGMIGISRP